MRIIRTAACAPASEAPLHSACAGRAREHAQVESLAAVEYSITRAARVSVLTATAAVQLTLALLAPAIVGTSGSTVIRLQDRCSF